MQCAVFVPASAVKKNKQQQQQQLQHRLGLHNKLELNIKV